MVEPIILRFKSNEHTRWFPMTGNHDFFLFRHPKKSGQVVLYVGQCDLLHDSLSHLIQPGSHLGFRNNGQHLYNVFSDSFHQLALPKIPATSDRVTEGQREPSNLPATGKQLVTKLVRKSRT